MGNLKVIKQAAKLLYGQLRLIERTVQSAIADEKKLSQQEINGLKHKLTEINKTISNLFLLQGLTKTKSLVTTQEQSPLSTPLSVELNNPPRQTKHPKVPPLKLFPHSELAKHSIFAQKQEQQFPPINLDFLASPILESQSSTHPDNQQLSLPVAPDPQSNATSSMAVPSFAPSVFQAPKLAPSDRLIPLAETSIPLQQIPASDLTSTTDIFEDVPLFSAHPPYKGTSTPTNIGSVIPEQHFIPPTTTAVGSIFSVPPYVDPNDDPNDPFTGPTMR